MKRLGKYTLKFENPPEIIAHAGCAGKKEGEGPLGGDFDKVFEDAMMGQSSWEKAESFLQRETLKTAIEKSGLKNDDINFVFSGDLLNQCAASAYGMRELHIPYLGQYGACSTMAQTIIMASVFCESGAANYAAAITSSHFCTAERQFRNPIDYGGQRPPSAQWTVTGSGAAIITQSHKSENSPKIAVTHATVGRITDFEITDANNMGAAMAPAAAETISDFLRDTKSSPDEFDCILTGDLGLVGSELLIEILKKNNIDISKVHRDCGVLIYNAEEQDVHAGGSGCGCSGSVLCSHVLSNMKSGKINRVLFVGTGSLQSTTSIQQGESIPGVAHAVLIESI